MIPELISNYLVDNKLSYREMAAKISWQLGVPNAITDVSITNWSDGTTTPRPTLFLLISKYGTGNLQELANQVLKELHPEQPVQG